MNHRIRTAFTGIALLALGGAALGCSSGVEYEVTGEVSSALGAGGTIHLTFYELATADAAAERVSVKESSLTALGSFTETVEVSEDAGIIVFALDDRNTDGVCNEGEAWAEKDVLLNEDGTAEPVVLALTVAKCPAATP